MTLRQQGITHIVNMVGPGVYDHPLAGGRDKSYFPHLFRYAVSMLILHSSSGVPRELSCIVYAENIHFSFFSHGEPQEPLGMNTRICYRLRIVRSRFSIITASFQPLCLLSLACTAAGTRSSLLTTIRIKTSCATSQRSPVWLVSDPKCSFCSMSAEHFSPRSLFLLSSI